MNHKFGTSLKNFSLKCAILALKQKINLSINGPHYF
jgi:hypothetical protein